MRVKIEEAQKSTVSPNEAGRALRIVDILNDMNRFIPKEIDVEITRLEIKPENIMISGNTDAYNSVDEMKKQLEQGDMFHKVTINSATIDKAENRLRFKLKVDL